MEPTGNFNAPSLRNIEAAQGKDEDVERAAYAADDPRYAGGDVYDLKNEQTSL